MKEPLPSENYLKSIELVQYSAELLKIKVSFEYTDDDAQDEIDVGYNLVFEDKNEEKKMRCESVLGGKVFWVYDLTSSENLTSLALAKTKELMDRHCSSLEDLSISIDRESRTDFDFGSEMLTKLETLSVNGKYARQLLGKTSNPLRDLDLCSSEDTEHLADCPQVYNVTKSLDMPRTRFNMSQFLQLNATDIRIPALDLSERDVFDFIELWKNRSLNRTYVRCVWLLPRYGFAIVRLFRFLNKPMKPETDIVQNETGDRAWLCYTNNELEFRG